MEKHGWVISSFSPNGNSCVAAQHNPEAGTVTVKNSNDPSQDEVDYTEDEWTAFLKGVKNGEFDFGLVK